MKGITLGFLTVFVVASARADHSIQLPSGAVVKTASFAVQPKWKECFPPDQPFYAEKFPSGSLQGMHGRDAHKLAGTSATLFESGSLKTLASYSHGVREGPVRVWNEDKGLVLYSQFKEGKQHGVTCLLKDGSPWLVQEWKDGTMLSESVLARSDQGDWRSVDDSKQLDEAQKGLAAVEADLNEIETDVRKNLREETGKDDEQIGKLKAKTNHAVNEAKIKAEYQKERKEEAAVVAGAHPSPRSRIGGAAQAEEDSAATDEKADNREAKATEKTAKKAVKGAVKAEAKHNKELYRFALTALERSL